MFGEYIKEILIGIAVFIAGILITEYGLWRGKMMIEKTIKKYLPEPPEELKG